MSNKVLIKHEKAGTFPLSEQAVESLYAFVRAPSNEQVKVLVYQALSSGVEPDYSAMNRDLKKYVRTSYDLILLKISALIYIKDDLPITQFNKNYILLVASLFHRVIPQKSIDILQALLCDNINQLATAKKFGVPQSNVSRLAKKFAEVDSLAKKSISMFLL
jgi:hypothetical protein